MNRNISIVIPTYNSQMTIAKTIESCQDQTCPKELIEIIVINDGSTDNTEEVVKRYPVKYIYQRNSGPAKARNTGWKAAQGEIICFTDADCVPEREWVARLVSNYISDKIAAVGGSYGIVNKENLLASCIHEEIIYRHSKMPKNVLALGSYNLSVRRKVLEEIGGFNEEYRMASAEDNDLSYKILKNGYLLIFDKDARVAHYHPHKMLKYLKSQFWHGFWRVKLYRDHPDMIKGDYYSNIWDYIQPPLFLIILFLLPFNGFSPVRLIFNALLIIGFIFQVPIGIAVIRKTKQLKYSEIIIVTFLRNFARGLGLFFAMINSFLITKKG